MIPALNILFLLQTPQIRGLGFLFLFLLGGCEDEMIQSVFHTQLKTNKQRNSLTFVKFISVFLFLIFLIYVYGCMYTCEVYARIHIYVYVF